MEVTPQEELNKRLADFYSATHKVENDSVGVPIIWAQNSQDAIDLAKKFKENFNIDFLSDLTAYDNFDSKIDPKRFVVVYQYYSTEKKIRIRVKLPLNEGEAAITLTDLWSCANWLEREVWDLYGVVFTGHPNLRRIMMDERFVGHPMRKDYPLKGVQHFPDSPRINLGANPLPKEKKS